MARGIAAKRSEYLDMGPAPGRYGRQALVRGGATHGPRNAERRQRVIERLKRQVGRSIQERLVSARVRLEAAAKTEEEEERSRKRPRAELADAGSSKAEKLSDSIGFPDKKCSFQAQPQFNQQAAHVGKR